MKINKLYLYSTILLMFLFPTISISIDAGFYQRNSNLIPLIGKWFIFWSIGCRLLTAGLKQVFNPSFTAETIFHFKNQESYVVIRELGFANICFGLTAVISLFLPSWRTAIAFSGGLFFGIAGLVHILRKPTNPNELIPLYSNVFVFFIILLYLINHIAF